MRQSLLSTKKVARFGGSACLVLDKYIQNISEIKAFDIVKIYCCKNKIVIEKMEG